jgi:plasmid maintenance system killer protein
LIQKSKQKKERKKMNRVEKAKMTLRWKKSSHFEKEKKNIEKCNSVREGGG